ncbi:hypothetical protein [Aporhodopirellula aestuarii]|uniref:Uncharacterized protein n=1 Tax=Aporhodopirellula aestuarii TaxID=2950107 RepID=A0ABT0U9R3_9BACT|nr:hypothetical protein [Aporhodopirellula aestuarii]MCM2373091.1 hypothetical protein [Aporhodopirellula aestuarii]
MNITWIPRTLQRSGGTFARYRVSLGVALTTLACSLTGTIADAQQLKSLQHGGQSFPVVQASEASSLFSEQITQFDSEIDQVACLGGARSNRGNSCNTGQYGSSQCSGQCGGYCGGAACGISCPTCQPYYYGQVDALMMRREGLSGFTRSRFFDLDEYDFELGPRITIGSVPDCVSGTEVSLTGPMKWEMANSVAGLRGNTFLSERVPGVLLGSTIPDQDIGFTFLYDPEISPADDPNDAVALQTQRFESTYWSIEASQTSIAWDVAKLLFGARYISFEEEYTYTASDGPTPAENGILYSNTTNDLIGLQVGLDMFTPVCRFGSTYLRARAGGYWNLAEATTIVNDQDERLYGSRDDDGNFAAMFELSNGVSYQFGEMLSVHAGSEVWYLAEIATVEDQLPGVVGARAPSRGIQTGDDVLFVGFNVGATLKY